MKEWKDSGYLSRVLGEYNLENVIHEPLRPHIAICSFEEGELVCSQGEPGHTLYVLIGGKLKIFTTSEEGKTLILSFKTPLELIGDIEYIRGTDIMNTVEAMTPVTMLAVPYRILHQYGDHAPLLQFLLHMITDKFFIKSASLSFNLLYPVEVRLASYLLSVSGGSGDGGGQPSSKRPVNLTDAAHLIGTSYRHVNRVIRQFCRDGLVERSRKGITVADRDKLQALAKHNIYEKEQ
jgi:CRP-like cAMP-binding protein